MKTLQDCITSIGYDRGLGIYAQLVDGKFDKTAAARYGQTIFENGGLLDGFQYFSNGEKIGNSYTEWCGDFDPVHCSQWDELCKMAGSDSKTAVLEWVDSGDAPEAAIALLDSARSEWDEQCEGMSNEWVDQIVEEMNEALLQPA